MNAHSGIFRGKPSLDNGKTASRVRSLMQRASLPVAALAAGILCLATGCEYVVLSPPPVHEYYANQRANPSTVSDISEPAEVRIASEQARISFPLDDDGRLMVLFFGCYIGPPSGLKDEIEKRRNPAQQRLNHEDERH